jgi:pyridoxamine 5'-phosphate oxidase
LDLAPDFTARQDPFGLFADWFTEAQKSEPNDPNAMSLATVGDDRLPNVRIVLLKGLDDAGPEDAGAPGRGFVFYTNSESAKGRELLAHPKAALAFHWKSLRRQVRVRGTISTVSTAEADSYFGSRPRQSQIGAWASAQSRPLESRAQLEAAVAKYSAKFSAGAIPRPPHWSGFRLVPVEIEFWADRPFRLHDRLVFTRPGPGEPWTRHLLYP